MKRVLLDTNLYIDWLNQGLHEELMLGRGLVRYLSAVVQLELSAGAATRSAQKAVDKLVRAYSTSGRLVRPSSHAFGQAGGILRRLKSQGVEVRRAALVHDVLIALTARDLGARLYSADGDFDTIRAVADFDCEIVR